MFRIELKSNTITSDWLALLDSFKNYANIKSKVLEIGASDIERTKQLSDFCGELIGLEYFPKRIPENFRNVSYVLGDCHKLSEYFRPESFDIIVASHVIEHLRDELVALNEIYKVLKPNGFALLTTPNRNRLTRAIIEFITTERKFPYGEHLREYAEEDLKKLAKSSKFDRYRITPRIFGLYGGSIRLYSDRVPKRLSKFANFWEIHLFR